MRDSVDIAWMLAFLGIALDTSSRRRSPVERLEAAVEVSRAPGLQVAVGTCHRVGVRLKVEPGSYLALVGSL